MKYINAEKLKALLEQRKKQLAQWTDREYANQRIDEIDCILDVDIVSLQQEQPEVQDLAEMVQSQSPLSVAYANRCFENGKQAMKEQMLKEAVEGKVFMSFAPGHNQMVMADVDLPTNTKVRIIVLKTEEE